MSVGRRLGEMDRTLEEVFDPETEVRERKTARSRWNVYEKTLRTVDEIAGPEPMRALATWIETVMREEHRIPTGREVRERGGDILRSRGHEVPADSFLHP